MVTGTVPCSSARGQQASNQLQVPTHQGYSCSVLSVRKNLVAVRMYIGEQGLEFWQRSARYNVTSLTILKIDSFRH